MPARVQFTIGREALYDFEKGHPALQPLIHTLLRSYEGIFDQPVPVRERQLTYSTRSAPGQVAADLAQLQAYHIIGYVPLKESPQLYFFRDRVSAEDLYIDPVRYRERKEQYATRIRAMVRYLNLSVECRSRYIGNYFGAGDKDAEDCGVCDHCLRAARGDRPSIR
jgi:ATP-dependent DNA helicase RecQ